MSDSTPQKSMLGWLWLAVLVVVLDLFTKYLASSSLDYAISVPVIPGFFNLTLLHNTGAAFSFLADEAGWQRWFFAALAAGVSVVLVRWLAAINRDHWLAISIVLVLGGALGNLYDRVVLGYVVDFLHFYWGNYHFPAFNLADSAISVGAVMMAIDVFRKPSDA
ncbi:MAG: signal peptidase II [Hahellaceae bacterium]|nr:signal peptidase II [Hahellaceae bacterium]MCP5170029.1 signal peptidase II [Hahellaceae bacterium]